jgi:hypothetical protein
MLGGSLAALTGLLFVATSIHINEIAKVPHWRIRAFSNTFALIGLLIQSALILIPQPITWLGLELFVFNLFMFAFIIIRLLIVWSKANAKLPPLRMLFGGAAWVSNVLGGASLMGEAGPGLLLNAGGSLVLIWVCLWNAWSLLLANYQD